ncbi:MAG: hypothetical protein ACI90Y_001742, partial [Polaromonas sp.]
MALADQGFFPQAGNREANATGPRVTLKKRRLTSGGLAEYS